MKAALTALAVVAGVAFVGAIVAAGSYVWSAYTLGVFLLSVLGGGA